MAKTSGLGSALWVGGADISGDIGSVSRIEAVQAVLSVTGIDKSAEERVLGRDDGAIDFSSYWDTTAAQAHATLTGLTGADTCVTCAAGTPALGSPAASMIAKRVTYTPSLGADGSLAAAVTSVANGYGLEWGELLTTGKQTFASGSVNGTAIDFGAASSAFGAAAYLHVFSLTSGNPTVTVADSANNSTFAALSPTSLAFTPTAAGFSRMETGATATIRQYVRVQVSGTYSGLVAALVFVRRQA